MELMIKDTGVFKIPKPHFSAHTKTPISILVVWSNFYFRLLALNAVYFGQSALNVAIYVKKNGQH